MRPLHLPPGTRSASCVIIFFTALTGLGYVDPDAVSSPATTLPDLDAPEVDFMPGQPVFDAGVAHAPGTSQEEVRRAEMRKLEQEWSRQKRPKDVSATLAGGIERSCG